MKKASFMPYVLPLTVFFTGACVLVVEVTAVRILSPYFGNTIYAFSSVISVILAALSLGYYYGGRLADKRPSSKVFFGIIMLSGLTLLSLQIISWQTLGTLSELPLTIGPLIVSLLFFFVPAMCMGALSPFAVKLQKQFLPKEGVGSAAGTIFFWSTLGSIIGSLLTGFVLIPHFGVRSIMLGCGMSLTVLGFAVLLGIGVTRKWLLGLGAIALVVITLSLALQPVSSVLYSKDGVYEKLFVFDGEYKGKPTRFFRQDRNNSSAMYLDSDELVYPYTKYYALHQVFVPNLQRALVIGGGIYSVPKALLQEDKQVQVDVAEVEPSLYDLAQKYFRLLPNERLHNHVTDARRFLRENDYKYDLIFGDAYQALDSIPAHLTTKEFFDLAKSRLSPQGIFVGNFIGDLSGAQPSLTLSEIKTFQQVFPHSYFFAVDNKGSKKIQNLIFVGANSPKPLQFDKKAITASHSPTIRYLPEHLIDVSQFDMSEVSVLTDDYAPVEYLTAQTLARSFD